jgi:hypothetical protein
MDNFQQHLQTHQRRMDQTPQTRPKKTTKRKLSPPAGPSPKKRRTVSPPPKTHQEKNRVAPIGARVVLPDFFLRNQGLVCLVGWSNGSHEDNLCFFRCLAVHRGTPNVKALEAPTKTYYSQYLQQQDITPADFKGVTLDDLVVLEHVFRLNVYVYDLQKTEAGGITTRFVRRSPYSFEDTMNLVCSWYFVISKKFALLILVQLLTITV